MFRIVSAIAVGMAILLPSVAEAQPKGLEIGKPFEGEIKTKSADPYLLKKAGPAAAGTKQLEFELLKSEQVFETVIPVALKAGQPLAIRVQVAGTDRSVAVKIFDSTGKRVNPLIGMYRPHLRGPQDARMLALAEKKTCELTIPEVSVSGKYAIVILSDAVGTFTITSAASEDLLPGKLTKKEVEEKIARLKRELADAEAALKALEEAEKKK